MLNHKLCLALLLGGCLADLAAAQDAPVAPAPSSSPLVAFPTFFDLQAPPTVDLSANATKPLAELHVSGAVQLGTMFSNTHGCGPTSYVGGIVDLNVHHDNWTIGTSLSDYSSTSSRTENWGGVRRP